MRKWIALVLLLLLALAGYLAAGPYLAIRGIGQALADQDTGRLSRYVDFPALRVNLRAQLQDQVVRRAGADLQANLLGAIALSMAGNVLGAGVDAAVTPAGVAALLQGRSVWKRALGDTADGDTYGPPRPADPLAGTTHRFESPSRFTATRVDEHGQATVFVFTRQGLAWKLSDIRLPL